jgi:nucleoporin SEH1
MQLASEFDAGHDDLVLDMAFNYYGTRMVTCSSDHKIKVWELVEHEWRLCDSWKGHDSAVLKVSWAHPSFGQLFCSCSYDKSIKVWEEQEQEQTLGSRRWIERAKLGQSKSMVQDVQFAPHYLGLKIASISADGMMMIYDAADPMKVSSWNLSDAFEVVNIATREPDIKYAFSWCQSKFQPPMMAVSSGREQPVRIFRLDQQNHWQPYESLLGNAGIVRSVAWAPNMGRFI